MSDSESIKSVKSDRSIRSDGSDVSNKPKGDTLPITFLIKFIKPFDGNRDELCSFIADCNKAFSLASMKQRLILLDYIQTQISGKAKAACVNRKFVTWDELKEFLKTMYQDVKHYSQLLCELTNLRQYSSEQVSQFSLRVETCLKKCINSIQQNSNNTKTLTGKLEMLQEIAINRFIYFSQPSISNALRIRDIKTLNEAISIAISEERVMNMYHIKNKIDITQDRKINYSSTNCKNNGTNQTQPYSQKSSNSKMGFQNNSTQNTLQCRYCKTKGHLIENCIKREYNNSRKNNSYPNHSKNSNLLPAEFGPNGRKQ